MMRVLLYAWLMLWAGTAQAQLGPMKKVSPLGWTADGKAFVYRAEIMEPWGGGIPDEDAKFYQARVGVVVDVVSGEPQLFVLSWQGEHVKPETQQRFGKKRPREFDAWLKAHPLVLDEGADSPGGRIHAQITVSSSADGSRRYKLAGAWKKRVYQWGFPIPSDGDDTPAGGDAELVFAIAQGGKKAPVLRWSTTSAGLPPAGSVRAIWSPDGRRVAWVIYREQANGEDPETYEVTITGVVWPRVQIKPDKQGMPGDLSAAFAAIAQAGFVATAGNIAEEHREATTVYAAPGFEADAARLSAVLPGGARVEPLTWKPDADLVVALGARSK